MSRRRPLVFWNRAVHRWLSMIFIVVAAIVIVQGALGIEPDPLWGGLALALLVLLAISGIWTAVHHYTVKLRSASRRRPAATRV